MKINRRRVGAFRLVVEWILWQPSFSLASFLDDSDLGSS